MALRVVLAGLNLDRDLLLHLRRLLETLATTESPEELRAARAAAREALALDNWTPETLSAAYARISRDPRDVTELRSIARAEVDKARRSNQRIVFGLGHSSVAEHAVFNLDLLGLSRLAVEALERQRLVSYTEKSQRYILLDEDFVVPEEIRGTPVESDFRAVLAGQNEFYREAYDRLLVQLRDAVAAEDKPDERALEGMAKEDARYALSLATTVQLGETTNARNLEALIARCRAHPLRELQDLGDALYNETAKTAPSLIRYVDPSPYLRSARADLEAAISGLEKGSDASKTPAGCGPSEPGSAALPNSEEDVRLVYWTPDPDERLIATLLFAAGAGPMSVFREKTASMDARSRRVVVESALRRLGPHDSVLREFEHVDLVFELIVSASCFAQLKRHRMATLTALPYDPALGLTIPDSFAANDLNGRFRELAARTEEVHRRILEVAAPAASYVLTNAHRRRVLIKLNARELIHVSRLREDAHAQWDIRRAVVRMVALARERMPLTLLLASGKDRFEALRRDLFPDG